jgi:hypothetical protein
LDKTITLFSVENKLFASNSLAGFRSALFTCRQASRKFFSLRPKDLVRRSWISGWVTPDTMERWKGCSSASQREWFEKTRDQMSSLQLISTSCSGKWLRLMLKGEGSQPPLEGQHCGEVVFQKCLEHRAEAGRSEGTKEASTDSTRRCHWNVSKLTESCLFHGATEIDETMRM